MSPNYYLRELLEHVLLQLNNLELAMGGPLSVTEFSQNLGYPESISSAVLNELNHQGLVYRQAPKAGEAATYGTTTAGACLCSYLDHMADTGMGPVQDHVSIASVVAANRISAARESGDADG